MNFTELQRYPPSLLVALWEDIHGKLSNNTDIMTLLQQRSRFFFDYQYSVFVSLMTEFSLSTGSVSTTLSKFPFPHLWRRIVQTTTKNTIFLSEHIYNIRYKIGVILLRMETIRSIKKMIIAWYRNSNVQYGTILARNRKDNLPDIRVTIKYRPAIDHYFEVAFSGRFKKDLEDGCFVIHTKKEGTTQEIVVIYCIYRSNPVEGKKRVYAYLDKHKTSVDAFDMAVQHIYAASKWDTNGYFVNVVQDYIMDYCKSTIYNKSFKSAQRLLRFATYDLVLAEYIWMVNFDTEKKRFALISDLELALRHQNKLLNANNIAELKMMLEKTMQANQKRNSSIYDDLPPQYWKLIQEAEKKHQSALNGTPVGCRGVRYYNSEEIDATRMMVKQAWIKADQWIGRNKNKKT